MPAATPQTPPPPPPPPYQPPPAYQASQAPAQFAPSPVRLPYWLDLGMIVIGVGAIVILVGFLFGDAAAGQFGAGGSVSTYQSDLEFFFVLTGVGILLTIGGWMVRMIMPLRKSRQSVPPSYAAPSGIAQPAPVAPAAPPMIAATPACANCGQPTTYIAQYGRYYCYSCARYA